MSGEILACHVTYFSIKKEDIVVFLGKLNKRFRYDNYSIYWDNLKSHYSQVVKDSLEEN